MLAHNKVNHSALEKITPIFRLGPGSTADSIFIIQSLLAAIIKDCAPIPLESNVAISKLKQKIGSLENKKTISDVEFFEIDNQFYMALPQVKKFRGLTTIIAKEKLHVDRMVRIALRQQESCKPIINSYKNILEGVQLNDREVALSALDQLTSVMEDYSLKVEKFYQI